MVLSKKDVPDMHRFSLEELRREVEQQGLACREYGFLFVSHSFSQWLRWSWLKLPIKLACGLYEALPSPVKKLLAAHLYIVCERV